jgi:two-component system sensor histidine kinase/response regulator
VAEPSGSASILIVDDTVENLRLLYSILSERGHEVRPATSGRLALEAAASHPPDAILLDINMPGMDGYEVCRRLKQSEVLRDVPVIFLTAMTETADKVKGFAAGGADYIVKPFQVEEVVARVDTHVALRRSRMQLQENFDRLRHLERLRDDLVHMIVHDIRSPLGALVMVLDHVQETAADQLGTKATESLESASQIASLITRMANDILDVSRLEEGKLPVQLQNVDLVSVCREAIEVLRPLEKSRQLELATSGKVVASCDPQLVQRVVENLVGNALKHTASTGRIEVAVSRSGSATRVEVRDNGSGVPPEARQKIFERYATLEARADSRYHSAGLGLTFCRMAVEAHGGRIGVDAAEPQGSVFWFELPAQPLPT